MRLLSFSLAIIVATLGPPLAAQPATPDELAFRQRLEERLQGLDLQLRESTGAIEKLQFELRSAYQRIEKLESELAASRKPVDSTTKNETSKPAPLQPSQSSAPNNLPGTLPAGDAQVEYDAAFGLLRRGEFEAGEQAFNVFLMQHPEHKLAGNARYWIAETLYARQRFQEAASAFLEAWQKTFVDLKLPIIFLSWVFLLERWAKTKKHALASINSSQIMLMHLPE